MRISMLVTVAALALPRDSVRAQDVMVMAQAIPVVTRADPTATRSALTEGYVSQPALMAHASYRWLQGVGTLNLEGLTLKRGELTTGAYGEGYVDRRHPHAYVHELLAGAIGDRMGFSGSLFAGRGFAPFGSDDPMVRPFEKYPVNHHLAQVLERYVAVAAVRRDAVIVEAGLFNGDEPTGPAEAQRLSRFGDSWSSRITVLPLSGLELSGSVARVKSPEVPQGEGLDQHKTSLVARFQSRSDASVRYVMIEWERTDEYARAERANRLQSGLAEASYCRAGVGIAARLERTDRPEEERLLDPFRTPRPATDLSTLGISRWTTITAALSAPPVRASWASGRPFVEVARAAVAPGNPPGIFSADLRYGASRLWMVSAGVRLHAGTGHERMGRYGAADPTAGPTHHMSGTRGGAGESDTMPGMSHEPMAMPASSHSRASSIDRCTL